MNLKNKNATSSELQYGMNFAYGGTSASKTLDIYIGYLLEYVVLRNKQIRKIKENRANMAEEMRKIFHFICWLT